MTRETLKRGVSSDSYNIIFIKMKVICVFFLVLLLSSSMARDHSYEELIQDLRKPALEVTIQQVLGHFNREKLVPYLGSRGYDIVRDGVGCVSGVLGGLDQGFTVADIIRQDPTDWFRYVFAAIFIVAWWQQNGQFITFYCGNFWELIH